MFNVRQKKKKNLESSRGMWKTQDFNYLIDFQLGKGNLTRKRVNLNETQHLKCDVLLRCPQNEYLDTSCSERLYNCHRIRFLTYEPT